LGQKAKELRRKTPQHLKIHHFLCNTIGTPSTTCFKFWHRKILHLPIIRSHYHSKNQLSAPGQPALSFHTKYIELGKALGFRAKVSRGMGLREKENEDSGGDLLVTGCKKGKIVETS